MLGACGGGSAPPPALQPPAAPPPSPPPPPPPTSFDTAEFRRNYGLGQINALPAYEKGASGAGVIVGVIDTGIDRDHPDLIGAISPASANSFDPRLTVEDADGHGTLVAGIIAARRNAAASFGVAFEAQILAVRAEDPSTCDSEEGCQFNDNDIANGIDIAVAGGARVINLSLGGGAGNFSFVNAVDRATRAGVIIVIAAGNADEETTAAEQANPTPFAQVALQPAANGLVIIAGATDETERIADFSHRAGVAQNVFVVAPGVSVFTTDLGGGSALASGTSFAAPHVAGALALLIDLFPNLTAGQLVDLVLSTARDTASSDDAPGTDAIYGRGLIDLGAAIAPRGTTAVPTASSVGTSAIPVALSGGRTPPAMGDALTRTGALSDLIMLDALERAYRIDLGARLAALPTTPYLEDRLVARAGWFSGRLDLGAYGLKISGADRFAGRANLRPLIGGAAEDRDLARPSRLRFDGALGPAHVSLGYGCELG